MATDQVAVLRDGSERTKIKKRDGSKFSQRLSKGKEEKTISSRVSPSLTQKQPQDTIVLPSVYFQTYLAFIFKLF